MKFLLKSLLTLATRVDCRHCLVPMETHSIALPHLSIYVCDSGEMRQNSHIKQMTPPSPKAMKPKLLPPLSPFCKPLRAAAALLNATLPPPFKLPHVAVIPNLCYVH